MVLECIICIKPAGVQRVLILLWVEYGLGVLEKKIPIDYQEEES